MAAAAAAFAHHILLVHSKPSSCAFFISSSKNGFNSLLPFIHRRQHKSSQTLVAASATDSLLQISKQGINGMRVFRGLTELISGPDGRSQMYTPSEFLNP
ncbi:hypothetical protein Tco_0744399 [Tanacetum coccineum]